MFGLYLIAVVLLHIPVVQNYFGMYVSELLENTIHSKVRIGKIDLGFFNRIIIDDVKVLDQSGDNLLTASRLSAKISPMAIIGNELRISSIQLFGMDANIYKDKATGKYNFQFIVDAFKSDKKPSSQPLDLRINSIILRNGKLSFRQQKEREAFAGRINFKDIGLTGISGHLILNKLSKDSLSVKVKKLSFVEKSGLNLKKLSFGLSASNGSAELSDFTLQLPKTHFAIDKIRCSFHNNGTGIDVSSLKYAGDVNADISPSDFAFILPPLRKVRQHISLNTSFTGDGMSLTVPSLTISSRPGNLYANINGSIGDIRKMSRWSLGVRKAHIGADFAKDVASALGTAIPDNIDMQEIAYADVSGKAYGHDGLITANAALATGAGNAALTLRKWHGRYTVGIHTDKLSLTPFVKSPAVDNLYADVTVDVNAADNVTVSGGVSSVNINDRLLHNIKFDISLAGKKVTAQASLNDNGGHISANGAYDMSAASKRLAFSADISNFAPSKFRLGSESLPQLSTTMSVKADLTGTGINDLSGFLRASNINVTVDNESFSPKDISITTGADGSGRFLTVDSDILKMSATGRFAYGSLMESLQNILARHVQSLPGKSLAHKHMNANDFKISATLFSTSLINKFANTNLVIDEPVRMSGRIADAHDFADISVDIPYVHFNGTPYRQNHIRINSTSSALTSSIYIKKVMDNGAVYSYGVDAYAHDNQLSTALRLNDNESHPIRGTISTRTHFSKDDDGTSSAHITVNPSDISIGDTVWNVLPATITYGKNRLTVNNFRISHNRQFIAVDGLATSSPDDALNIKLKDINIEYILNLVNFHSVDFSGMASGHATVAALFSKRPQASATLDVGDFRFEGGRMGTLHANVDLNNDLSQIDIDAVADDAEGRSTVISGYVSPQRSDISLDIAAHDTRLEFVEGFCSSFMSGIDAKANGKVHLYGPLSNINLTGHLDVNGQMGISSLNTTYYIEKGGINFVPDAIIFENDTITDRNGNIGIVTGKLGHQHLTRLTYDIEVEARNLLSYDTHTFGDNTFYGTAYVTGDCKIQGKSGEVNINVNGTPGKGSILVYNVASPDAIAPQDFIKWTTFGHDATGDTLTAHAGSVTSDDQEYESDMRINFLINCTPDATIRLLMDNNSGDYITLNGNGVLKANYYNKGTFDLYGNYAVSSGHYKMTIQNVIKRDFQFSDGGTINFGGNPYSAVLNLKALYTLNSVSLADLNIGKSFRSNNTRVDCIMNITGTPASPHVDFNLDVPSISSDARQMIYSLMNSEEEMNQQVLYLLAVGRFMNQGRNNAVVDNANQQSQASLAMQSILSSTVMQQVNDVIGNLTSNSQWNFGANISTGTEGLYNAEYEGLLSGRLLSGRLLVDGQFGYRDKANATTSFIGDFDIQYLLFPNGNLAVNFYNKTNDRYFTRNSLTTQGIGLLIKKDFGSLSDLFGFRKRRRAVTNTDNKKKQ